MPQILGDREIQDLDKTGLRIDGDDGAMGRVGKDARADRRLIGSGRIE